MRGWFQSWAQYSPTIHQKSRCIAVCEFMIVNLCTRQHININLYISVWFLIVWHCIYHIVCTTYWYSMRVCMQSSLTTGLHKDVYAFLCLRAPTKEVIIIVPSLSWFNLDRGCASRGDGESLARAQWTCTRGRITGFWLGRSWLAIATWWRYPDASRFQALSWPWTIGWPFFPKLCAAFFFDISIHPLL